MSEQPSHFPQRKLHSPALMVALYALIVVMSLVQSLIIFRGLNSAQGMDQAQIAREIARGNGWQTKLIRPYAWQQMIVNGKDPQIAAMPETFQPPLQPFIWSPVFRTLEKWSDYQPGEGSTIYLLDRVIAFLGVAWFLLAMLFTFLAIRQLFDDRIAGVTVLLLVLCQPLWDAVVSGSPHALLMLLFAMAFWCFVHALQAASAPRGPWLWLAGLAVICGLMSLTHWMALWIVFGLVASVAVLLPQRLAGSVLVAAGPAVCLLAWGFRNHAACGDAIGAAKATIQSLLIYGSDQSLLRDFQSMNSQVAVDSLLRKIGVNLQWQAGNAWSHLAMLLPAAMFFLSWLHRFRSKESGSARWAMAIVFTSTMAGMLLAGLDREELDDNDMYLVLIPAMTGFGLAMFAVMWARLDFESGWFRREWGYVVLAVAVSVIPMFNKLPQALRVGLAFRSRLANWPPYMPDRFANLNRMVKENEALFTDAPWAIAWYADRTAVWMPVSRRQFDPMKAKIESQGGTVAGFVITPVSSKVERLFEVFESPYREWADIVYRGPMLAFNTEVKTTGAFAYNAVYPLMAQQRPDTGGLNVLLVYYADKVRWDSPKTAGK